MLRRKFPVTRHPMDNVETYEMIKNALEQYVTEDLVDIQLGRWRDAINERYQKGYRDLSSRIEALESHQQLMRSFNDQTNEAAKFWFDHATNLKNVIAEQTKEHQELKDKHALLIRLLADKGIYVCP